jgi:hypothetical protein
MELQRAYDAFIAAQRPSGEPDARFKALKQEYTRRIVIICGTFLSPASAVVPGQPTSCNELLYTAAMGAIRLDRSLSGEKRSRPRLPLSSKSAAKGLFLALCLLLWSYRSGWLHLDRHSAASLEAPLLLEHAETDFTQERNRNPLDQLKPLHRGGLVHTIAFDGVMPPQTTN